MKILEVVHYFLPLHQAGTEVYTAALARGLAAKGHEVSIFTSEDGAPGTGRLELRRDEWEGLPVHRLYSRGPRNFEETYIDPEIDSLFARFIAERRPDAVHFQHAFKLSAGMIQVCRAAGVPAAVTLADYWFICPPILLLRPGCRRCEGPEPDRCARCGNSIGALYAGSGPGAAGRAREALVRAAHAAKRGLPSALVERMRAWKQARDARDPDSDFQARRRMIEKRRETMARCLDAAGMAIAPSRFLRERVVEAGAIEPGKIIYSDYGFDRAPFAGVNRKPSAHVRFGFIGTPVEHKGLHVAVEAMNRFVDTDAELKIYGDLTWFPAYARRLRKLARNPRVRFMGRFEHARIGEVLSEIDVSIVPSLWYENSPLTIHEAFMAGAPVLVSDLGGMAELVENGGGLAFRAGDPDDLAAKMRELAAGQDRLAKLRASIPRVKTIEENADEILAIFRELQKTENE